MTTIDLSMATIRLIEDISNSSEWARLGMNKRYFRTREYHGTKREKRCLPYAYETMLKYVGVKYRFNTLNKGYYE